MAHHLTASSTLVFVFGTLKEGYPNFHANAGLRVPGDYITVQKYPLYLVGERHSPWLIDQPGEGHQVVGQVFSVDRAALEQMDVLERVHERDGYRRVMIDLAPMDARTSSGLKAFAYLKSAEQFHPSTTRTGPLPGYTLEHAALYRKRSVSQ
jgi:gamma-glutamylaminecyclotransferase